LTFVSKKLKRVCSAIAEAIDFPEDSFVQGAFVEISDNRIVRVHYAASILNFSDNCVSISSPPLTIHLKGRCLDVSELVGGSLTVRGEICSLEFERTLKC